MREQRLFRWAALLALAVAGCGSGPGDELVVPTEAGAVAPAPPAVDFSLATLLTQPRADLAAKADELHAQVLVQEKAHRDGQLPFPVMPELHLPLVVPVLRQAKFSPEIGLSVPPYHAKGPDSGLALHLARYGDIEAAKKLVGPADTDAVRQIDALKAEKNYPLEWTRLVGLMQHAAQLRLAAGEPEGARDLMALHQQLRDVLDARAAQGPLGAALLGAGRKVLRAAQRADQPAGMRGPIEAALAAWGEVPPPAPAVLPGTPRASIARLLGSNGQGRVIAAALPLRGLDLLDLPLPPDGVASVLACVERNGALAEVVVLYRKGTALSFPSPADLAHRLEECSLDVREGKAPGLVRSTYTAGPLTWEVGVVSRGELIGGFVRIAGPAAATPPGPLPRDFGAVHLDRSFEQNRLRLTPEENGGRIVAQRPEVLANITNTLRNIPLRQAVVTRAPRHDVAAHLLLSYAQDEEHRPLHESALGLWAAGGPAHFVAEQDDNGGRLVLEWDDGATRIALRLPYESTQGPELEIEDARDEKALAKRVEAARTHDLAERKARLAAGKPLTRLPRHLDSEALRLGLTRAEALQALPQGANVLRQELPDGVAVVVMGEAPKTVPYVARHQFIRFDGEGRVAELRTRYAEAGGGTAWVQGLLTRLTKQSGAARETAGPWARVWSELPARKPAPTLSWWQDDLTVLTCQRDAWGVELVLRDASRDNGLPTPLAALSYLPRGPVGVSLGDDREGLLPEGTNVEKLPDGGVLLPSRSPGYDAIMVWFDEEEKASRIVARHAQPGAREAKPPQLAQRLQEVWAEQAGQLGWPRRYDAADGALQSLGWHDEQTRVRLSWQPSASGPPRLFTEWRPLNFKN